MEFSLPFHFHFGMRIKKHEVWGFIKTGLRSALGEKWLWFLLCFFDISAFPQYLLLGVYYNTKWNLCSNFDCLETDLSLHVPNYPEIYYGR